MPCVIRDILERRACGLAIVVVLATAGCGTTRLTDTQRTGTEQLLVSNAIDQAVSEIDFRELAGKSVYFDPQYLDGTVDRGYLVSSMRQQLLATGCLLQEDRTKATYVVEVRSGGIGTDRHAVLVGVPQMNVPAFVPGQPSQIPEIPLAKKTDQEGMAKIAIFAYNRFTGKIVWQSGLARAMSTSKDMWVLGAGPFQRGSIRNGTEFAGEQLPLPVLAEIGSGTEQPPSVPLLAQPAYWPETVPANDPNRLAVLLGRIADPDSPAPGAQAEDSGIDAGSPIAAPPSSKWPLNQVAPTGATSPESNKTSDGKPAADPKSVSSTPASPSNTGGQAETESNHVLTSGLTSQLPTADCETEPRAVTDNVGAFKPDM